jgi:hypothetical protein
MMPSYRIDIICGCVSGWMDVARGMMMTHPIHESRMYTYIHIQKMICNTENQDLCAGVSMGPYEMPFEGLPLQLKSVNRSLPDYPHMKMAFSLQNGVITSEANSSLGIGRGLFLISNVSRFISWNVTELGQLRFGDDCLTAMTCNQPGPDWQAEYCDPDSPYPVWEYRLLRRGAYLSLYPCLYRMLGQRWEIRSFPTPPIPTQLPSNVPTATFVPTLPSIPPTMLPTSLPTYAPTDAPTYAPTDAPTYVPTMSPTYVPSLSPSHMPSMDTSTTTLTPSLPFSSPPASNVEAQPLYAIAIAFALLIALITLIIYCKRRQERLITERQAATTV